MSCWVIEFPMGGTSSKCLFGFLLVKSVGQMKEQFFLLRLGQSIRGGFDFMGGVHVERLTWSRWTLKPLCVHPALGLRVRNPAII